MLESHLINLIYLYHDLKKKKTNKQKKSDRYIFGFSLEKKKITEQNFNCTKISIKF